MAKTLATLADGDVSERFEECVGCKWTLHILSQVRRGVARPAPGSCSARPTG